MRTIKGEELVGKELEVLDDGTLRLIEKPMKFIPNVGERYWYLNYGEVAFDKNDAASSDNWIINHQLVFRTKKECEDYTTFLELLDKYKCELNWEDANESKYYLYYDKSNDYLDIDGNLNCQTQGVFYFKSQSDVKEFIAKAGKDNIKRFMFDVWE